MKTTSIMIQSLCVPCFNHCRHCLLCWDGRIEGANWDRSIRIAERLLNELRTELPEINSQFSFGYSMEHPDLREAIRTLSKLGSVQSGFLQCDGMKMRTEQECDELMRMLHSERIRELNFTVYGSREFHDSFARREGDYDLLVRMMESAKRFDVPFSVGIPLVKENINQIEALVAVLNELGSKKVFLFIPHEEGRGKDIQSLRVRKQELSVLSDVTRRLLNDEIFRSEAEWLEVASIQHESQRMILISLRPDNVEEYEHKSAVSIVNEIESLDDEYYSSFPNFKELAEEYGDTTGDGLYRFRDLFHHYRNRYAEDHDVHVYDVTDERQSGSRRY